MCIYLPLHSQLDDRDMPASTMSEERDLVGNLIETLLNAFDGITENQYLEIWNDIVKVSQQTDITLAILENRLKLLPCHPVMNMNNFETVDEYERWVRDEKKTVAAAITRLKEQRKQKFSALLRCKIRLRLNKSAGVTSSKQIVAN